MLKIMAWAALVLGISIWFVPNVPFPKQVLVAGFGVFAFTVILRAAYHLEDIQSKAPPPAPAGKPREED